MIPQLQVLYQLFDIFNESKFDNQLQKPMITIQSCNRKPIYGWCSTLPVWEANTGERYYEINIVAEYFNRPFKEICETLLHELVHLSNLQKGIQDVDKKKHNLNFKNEAERVGLVVNEIRYHGFAETSLGDELKAYIDTLEIDNTVFNIHRLKNANKKIVARASKIKMKCPKCQTIVLSTNDIEIECVECCVKFEKVDKGDK